MLNILPSVVHSFIQSVFILSVSYMQLVSWATEDPGAAALGWVLGHLVHLPRARPSDPPPLSFDFLLGSW